MSLTNINRLPADDTCVTGQLEHTPLPEMLFSLHRHARSAMLRIGVGLHAGVIFFDQGVLYRCEWGHLGGEPALMALLGVTSGQFALIQRDLPQARRNILQPTGQLLQQLGVVQAVRERALHAQL